VILIHLKTIYSDDNLSKIVVNSFSTFEQLSSLLLLSVVVYLVFNITYFAVFFVKKIFNFRFELLKITTIIILVPTILYIFNDHYRKSKIQPYLSKNDFYSSDSIKDTLNFNYKEYVWSKKEVEPWDENIVDLKLKFINDTSIILITKKTKFDRLYLFRKYFEQSVIDTSEYILKNKKYLLDKYLVSPLVPDYTINVVGTKLYLEKYKY